MNNCDICFSTVILAALPVTNHGTTLIFLIYYIVKDFSVLYFKD